MPRSDTYTPNERLPFETRLTSFAPSLRVAVELRHFAERSFHETADTLAVSLGAAKSRLFHARAALRDSQKLRRFRNTNLKQIGAVKTKALTDYAQTERSFGGSIVRSTD